MPLRLEIYDMIVDTNVTGQEYSLTWVGMCLTAGTVRLRTMTTEVEASLPVRIRIILQILSPSAFEASKNMTSRI